MGRVGSEVRRSEVWSCASGFGKKYGLELKSCSVEPKTKGRIALSGLRSLFDKSCFQTLAYQSSAL